MPGPASSSRRAACLAGAATLVASAACGVEYRPGRRGPDSARAAAAHAESLAAARRVDTVVRVDTLVRVDTVLVRDTLPALGIAPPDTGAAPAGGPARGPADSFRVARRPDAPGRRDTARGAGARGAGARGAGAPAAGRDTGAPRDTAAPVVTNADLAALRQRGLRVPVQGVAAARVPSTFNERRDGGSRPHHALDIPAPRGTPVVAAADGRVLKLFDSRAGGLTVYVLDPSGRFVYYYAHLDAYRPGLAEGQAVRAGDPLGTVGSSGNANPATPHLHFALARLDDPRRWWAGTPVDPKPFLR